MRRAVVALVSLICAVLVCGQQSRTVQVRELKLTSSHEISAPPFRYRGLAQCDEAGLMYFLLGSGFDVSVMRLNPRTGQPILFTDKQEGTFLREWYALDGRIIALIESAEGNESAVEFDSDGKVKRSTKLDLPTNFRATNFVTLPSGTFFVEGYLQKPEQEAGEMRASTFLLKSDGARVKEILISANVGKQNEEGVFFKLGGAAYADGRLYVLGTDKLFILSEAGELIDAVKLERPEADMRPRRVMISDGTIAIEYTQIEGGGYQGKTIATYVLLRGTPLERLGVFRPGEDLNNSAACFQQGEFSFIRFVSGKIILKASKIQ